VYGVDRLVTGDPVRSLPSDVPAHLHNGRPAAAFIADCPIDAAQKARLLTLYTDTRDVLAGKSPAEKERLLSTTSYRAYLQGYYGLDERSLAMFDGRTLDLFASKSEAVSALLAWGCEYPGFQGLGLQMPKAGILEGDPYIYHFPDGNASLARLFVREMIPGVAAGRSMDDIVSARFLISGNKIRIINGRKRFSEKCHIRRYLTLKVIVEDLRTLHSLVHGKA